MIPTPSPAPSGPRPRRQNHRFHTFPDTFRGEPRRFRRGRLQQHGRTGERHKPEQRSLDSPDYDADFQSDLNDGDDDGDSLSDPLDHFARDAANGTNVVITSAQGLFYPMFSTDPGTGMFGLGFTGLMNNGTSDYLDQYIDDNLLAGGATGTFTIINTTSGDAIKTKNNQANGFQFGVTLDPSVVETTVTARVLNPFKSQNPQNSNRPECRLAQETSTAISRSLCPHSTD